MLFTGLGPLQMLLKRNCGSPLLGLANIYLNAPFKCFY